MNESSLTSLPPVSAAADATADDSGEDNHYENREDSKSHKSSSGVPVMRFVNTVNMVLPCRAVHGLYV